MKKPAKLCSPLIWPHKSSSARHLPHFFVMSDIERLPDPSPILHKLPRGSAVILRHPDHAALAQLANTTIAQAHRLGLKVLIANDIRLAISSGADGVHLSEQTYRLGPWKRHLHGHRPGFIITTACHSIMALKHASRSRSDAVFLSPVFPTQSHPQAQTLGPTRFQVWAQKSPKPVMALGGIEAGTAKRLHLGSAVGFGAIQAWHD
ncbi:MAG: thiamine phosphate synthase [Magnetovibrio sp.]|nr:thiamine phosphate synthase [Magnetovibrio sp.]